MINRIYNTVKFISNNQIDGNVTPFEYNLALHNRILEKYEGYFAELNRFINRENKGLITNGLGEMSNKLRERIAHFLDKEDITINVDNTVPEFPVASFDLPDNHRYTDYIVNHKNKKPFQIALSRAHFDTLNRYRHTKPTESYPICYIEGRSYLILPETLEKVTLYFLRQPKIPNWTHIPGTELFNPADPAFQDVDMHPSEENELTILVLKSFGINLKEPELVEIANSEEMQEFQKDNNL